MTRIIVCDTGLLLHLSEAGAIQLLSSAGEVLTSVGSHSNLVSPVNYAKVMYNNNV
jgi:hypothetical protein